MRKNNWIVTAIAAVACGVLLWAWFALGFNHVDDPLDLVVAVAWWLVVAAVAGGIVWAEGKRREKMRLAFVGEGAGCSPEAGLVMPDAGESELAALERTARAWRSPTRWPRWTSACAPPSAGWCGAASSTATARSGRARSSPPTTRTPSRARSRPARTWPPSWRRRGDPPALRGRDIANREGAGALTSVGPLLLMERYQTC